MHKIDELPLDVDQRIAGALLLYDRLGATLGSDRAVRHHLVRLAGHLGAVEQTMQRLGLPALCTDCAAEPKGGCCFAGMVEEADVVVLTVNLLLGCAVKRYDRAENECCFLGHRGCTLRCKPLFCLSYTCPKMIQRFPPQGLAVLDATCAQALREQLALERRLSQLLSRHGSSCAPSGLSDCW